MRYAEKSFEVRFCAALTAAIMPMNRNPKWFGLTQAQERKAGIDTVLGIGGRLLIFQFKAKKEGRIKIERRQWEKLLLIENKYPGSVFYVFPEAEDIFSAGAERCLFEHSWCTSPIPLKQGFREYSDSVSLNLNIEYSCLERNKPNAHVSCATTCHRFGCFCPPHIDRIIDSIGLISLLRSGWPLAPRDVVFPPFSREIGGIPLQARDSEDKDLDGPPIQTEKQFEELFDDDTGAVFEPGAYGLFIS